MLLSMTPFESFWMMSWAILMMCVHNGKLHCLIFQAYCNVFDYMISVAN